MFLFAAIAKADDRPVTIEQLPAQAKAFLTEYYPEELVLYSTKDDDIILPDFNVVLENGVRLEFYNNGALKKVEALNGVPVKLIPPQIVEFVKARYPDTHFISYDVDRRDYEVTLSNRLDLTFTKNFHLIEIDD